jgi:uncharacterized membrane protein
MIMLTLDALIWLGLHLGLSGTNLRGAVIGRIGLTAFRALFAAAALAVMVMLCRSYAGAGMVLLWIAPGWLRGLLALAMLPALVLFVASFRANPMAAGGEPFLGREAQGIQRVTRHPMMVAFALWAAVHMIGNGDAASLVFFGTFFITAAAGMPSIDRKTAARDPDAWARLARSTSILPFAAILTGRNRLVPSEIGWLAPLAGVALWAGVLIFHRSLFGVSPVMF